MACLSVSVPSMNVWADDWGEQAEDWSGGGGLAKRLVPAGPQLGAALYELRRGNFMVFHLHHGAEEARAAATLDERGRGNFMVSPFHHGPEELLVVLRGQPPLRTRAGERQLQE